MNSTRILSFTLCLGLACLLLTGSAVAGTTAAPDVTYAREVGSAGLAYTLPVNAPTRLMNVLRGVGGDFFLDITLEDGALWDATGPPAGGEILCAPLATAVYTITLIGAPAGTATATYSVVITIGTPTTFPTCTFTATGLAVTDVNNQLGLDNSISLNISTRDAGTGVPIDVGTESDVWLVSGDGADISDTLVSMTATVDVATARTVFVGTAPNDLTNNRGATIGLDDSAGPLNAAGLAYSTALGDFFDLIVTGDLSGISSITYAPLGIAVTDFVLPAEVTAGSTTLSIPGNHVALGTGPISLELLVDGTTTLNPRTVNVTVNLRLVASGPAANSRELAPSATLTVWNLNGTVLIANFINGNNALFSSRVYLWNASSNTGDISIRVFTLPLSGASTLLATVNLGSLPGLSGRNIRVDPDLAVIGFPYLADGGNLVLEITVEATDVTGLAQVFQLDLSSFGIYTLEVIN